MATTTLERQLEQSIQLATFRPLLRAGFTVSQIKRLIFLRYLWRRGIGKG